MNIPNLNFSTWAGITAALALIGGFWQQFLGVIKRIMDLFICRVVVKGDASRALMSHVWKNGKKSPFGLRLFAGLQSFVSPNKRVEVIAYEGITSDPLLFWFGRVPILVGMFNNDKGTANIGDYASETTITVRYFRGSINFDNVLEEAITAYNRLRQNRQTSTKKIKRFNVFRMHGTAGYGSDKEPSHSEKGNGNYPVSASDPNEVITRIHQGEFRLLTWKPEELIEKSNDSEPFTNHPVAPELLEQFNEITTFLDKEQWFRSKGIPWRKGYLIHGPGGGGKTTLIRNIALKHDLPIYSFDLSTYDNRSFVSDWKTAQQNAPAIILLEDFDVTFSQRKNLAIEGKNRDGLSFDCLLNTISGVGFSDGILLFVTTNRLESLDPALGCSIDGTTRSTRPGRIDRAIYIGPMGKQQRQRLAEIILADCPAEIPRVVAEGDGEMAAQFQERCAQVAIARFWEAS